MMSNYRIYRHLTLFYFISSEGTVSQQLARYPHSVYINSFLWLSITPIKRLCNVLVVHIALHLRPQGECLRQGGRERPAGSFFLCSRYFLVSTYVFNEHCSCGFNKATFEPATCNKDVNREFLKQGEWERHSGVFLCFVFVQQGR